ncbi:hypothetical protein LOK49_LG13G02012 [Camellia lanceoleosa]|uniref:Uncharacterized protein n=1 Tax=Camellia lanceoleosa TaxID=1840588 RepID=A0ACC0FF26_9ERIC|nr:hypothetical protein LOK49_LG13G02012 [Camellia lanceoleosa]
MKIGYITGDRINGLVDGISGNWYCKFDTFTPTVERGLPVTRVISRMTLQQILAGAMGEDVIMNDSNVVNFEDDGDKVTMILENGQRYEVMTRTYPEDSGERKELILLQNIASYMLLACGAVYLISIEEDSH